MAFAGVGNRTFRCNYRKNLGPSLIWLNLQTIDSEVVRVRCVNEVVVRSRGELPQKGHL